MNLAGKRTIRPSNLASFFLRRELDRLKNEIEAAENNRSHQALFQGLPIKCELAVGTGKNHRDKRQDLKKRDAQRETDQAMKNAMKR